MSIGPLLHYIIVITLYFLNIVYHKITRYQELMEILMQAMIFVYVQ